MKKITLTLGLLLTTGFAASQFFSSSPKEEQNPVSVRAPQPVAEALDPAQASPALRKTKILQFPKVEASGLTAPNVEEIPNRVLATTAKAAETSNEEDLPALSATAAPELSEQELNEPLATRLSLDSADKLTAASEEIPDSPQNNEEAQEAELLFQPHVGYSAKYIKLQQSGAFGGGDGGVDIASGPSVGVNLKYGQWSFAADYEKMSVKFPVDSGNTKEKKDFKTLSLTGGYGILFLGAKARTAPLVRAGTTALTWADITKIEALGGLRVEKLYAGRRRKPFLLGGELEGSAPMSVSANGGPAVSNASGFGLSLKGYAEKAFVEGKAVQLKIGLEISAAYEQTKFKGTWSGLNGTATRMIQEYGSKVYVGMEF